MLVSHEVDRLSNFVDSTGSSSAVTFLFQKILKIYRFIFMYFMNSKQHNKDTIRHKQLAHKTVIILISVTDSLFQNTGVKGKNPVKLVKYE